jgi:hypothetical protein
MSINKQITILVLFACIAMTSCAGQQAAGTPTLDVDAIQTSAVNTFTAAMNQTQTEQALLATQTPSPTVTSSPTIAATAPLPPTWTPAPLLAFPTLFIAPTVTGTQYTPTTDPSLLAAGCNNSQLINDVNVPSGSVFNSKDSFTKTWKVANSGTCNWIFSYQLIFVSGDQMGGGTVRIGKTIVPGKWTQVSVGLTAPKSAGTYTGYWRMATQTGSAFGATLTVSIVVGTPTNTPVPPTSYP